MGSPSLPVAFVVSDARVGNDGDATEGWSLPSRSSPPSVGVTRRWGCSSSSPGTVPAILHAASRGANEGDDTMVDGKVVGGAPDGGASPSGTSNTCRAHAPRFSSTSTGCGEEESREEERLEVVDGVWAQRVR